MINNIYRFLWKFFQTFWILSIISFSIFLLLSFEKISYSNYWLYSIVLGSFSYLFYIAFRSAAEEDKKRVERIVLTEGLIGFILCLIVLFSRIGIYLNKSKTTVLGTQNNNLTPTPTLNPTIVPTQKSKATTLSSDPEAPKIRCMGPDGNYFDSTQQVCDSFRAAWGKGPNPTFPKTNPSTGGSNSPSYNYNYSYTPTQYYSCTLYYPYQNTFSTYNYLYKTKAECDAEQAKINQLGTTYLPPATPTPTPVPTVNQQACSQAVVDWNSYVENFYATTYNDFNSSAEAVIFLLTVREDYQAILNSYGCTNYLRVY